MIKSAAFAGSTGSGAQRKMLKERFKRCGLEGFYDHEIIELLLSYAALRDAATPARALLERFRGLRGVFDATVEELGAAPGIGENAAVLLRLVKETAGVYMKERMMGSEVVSSPESALDYLNLTLSGERVEKFLALYLNTGNEVIALELLHEGTINQTVVYPRKAIELAFRHNASGVIFVHNHPGGSATLSSVDRRLAMALDRAALAVDLVVHDHIIIGREKHFSARENGWTIGCRFSS